MPKASAPPYLNLSSKNNEDVFGLTPATLSPRSTGSPHTPESPPGSPFLQEPSTPSIMHPISTSQDIRDEGERPGPNSPTITAIPEFPPSPVTQSPRHGREASKSFFSNLMASKSSHKLQSSESSIPESGERPGTRSRPSSKDRSVHSVQKQGSTPELSKMGPGNSSAGNTPASSEATPQPASEGAQTSRKVRSKLGGILTRTKTLKLDEQTPKGKGSAPGPLQIDSTHQTSDNLEPSPRTAPIKMMDHRERVLASQASGPMRNHSADRHRRDESSAGKRERLAGSMPASHSFREGSTLQILSNIGQTGKGMGDRLGKAGKGFFGKITRSASSTERELVTDDNYTCTTINLPLVKQTRKTRIARRLDLSKDKTEFWMPALPWRCIDYLNMNGAEEEGLYRIPGSGRDVKHWQRRFDTEYDINLFDEPELYDINTIGSLFKSWLRELPDEILPREVQSKISSQCAGATSAPQLLKDELSRLPPFNYYLLFAITCHLSLLNHYADKNKMDFRNLCICFQPCLKIDLFCFQFLVMDWKNCWQGCWTEQEYLEEEYRYEREGSINEAEDSAGDERAISSSGSSQPQAPMPPRTADAGAQRKSTMLKSKQRSLSSEGGARRRADSGHAVTQSVPTVPRVVTPEPPALSLDQKLPELTGLSPIRM
ncbi:hypothetical protein HRR83_003243 [Exophiala dermatitidis]|uniref:RalA-binding protein 1 n=2 Tax=Exophiala dermatitidis TaxID=5970 RepID=H6BNC4_EXODN|nr:RalA-binding protein 1 [Exophiala dermatitidis NIH/UT8656]KAJ4514843.1 hypothetical protein HRR75_004207 [Exophiala dermatitidis]EHY52194.1 RalA-binding protein 1 [Exophiala dermatitidis NIH/UT8656]KAJ4518305.1 hypothetical protein HRR74_004600 [Exophiala dermatitidis]KAJ4521203.1 hypothetical protein HRR73_003544 [Exophiala dermatitidis]KAJ4547794.1 hypothetical protein HRR76_000418 [Exophiala dermatitidis]